MKRDSVDTTPRRTGLAPLPELPWGSHLCIFFDSPDDLLSLLPSYFIAGLEQDEMCFAIASPELGLDRVREALRRGIPDFDAHLASGAFRLVDGRELFGSPVRFDRLRAFEIWKRLITDGVAAGYAGVRGFGEQTWLESGDWEAFSTYEADIEGVLQSEPALILCGYPIDSRSAKELFAVASTHDVVLARLKQRWHVLESANDDESRLLLQTQRARLQRDLLRKERDIEGARAKLADADAERLRLDQALKTLQDRFDAALATTPVGLVIKRIRDDRIIEVNDAFLRKLGYPRHEVVGGTAVELGMWDAAVARYVRERQRAMEWRVDGLEVTARARDGRLLDVVLYTQPLEIEGELCLLITVYDQTASKDIERELVEQQWLYSEAERLARTGSWQWSGGTLTWSAELYRLHGLSPGHFELSFDAWTALVHPADRKRFRDAIDSAMRDMKSFEVQHRIVLPDGASRVLRSNGYCARRGDGDADFRVVGYSTDITELSETMDELRATSRKLVDLQELSRRQLATDIHDRIGQLLTAISMNLETMRPRVGADRNLQGRLEDSIRLVQMATDAVVNILGDLRPVALEELGLVPALQRFCANFSKRAGIEASLDLDIDGASLKAEWSTPIFRIVQEGLMNAAKHAGARHVRVRFFIDRGDLAIAIEDDGVGIGSAQSTGAPSSGLGLVTTRERVAALGGTFSIEPREGGGTKLSIRLPLGGPPAEAARGSSVSGIY